MIHEGGRVFYTLVRIGAMDFGSTGVEAGRMERIRMITHRDRQIAYLDFSDVRNTEQGLAAIEQARRLIQSQPEQSVLTLTNVAGAHFDAEILSELREMVSQNRRFVVAGAVVGLKGLQRVAYTAMMRITGRNIKAFEDEDKAGEWLVGEIAKKDR